MEGFHDKQIATVGFEGGDIILLRTKSVSDSPRGSLLGHSKSHHTNSIFDMSVSGDDSCLASASDVCVKIYDCAKNCVTREFESGHAGSIKQVKFHPTSRSLILTSTRSGTISLFDLRDPDSRSPVWYQGEQQQYSMTRCHDIKIGKIKRPNVSVTSLAWGGDNTAVSAGEGDA
jgi:WD40 repeat protein